MKEQFDFAWNYFFKEMATIFKIIFALFTTFCFVAALISFAFYSESFEYNQLTKNVMDTFFNIADGAFSGKFFSVFFNNLKIIFAAFFFGIIPFLFLPLFLLPFNSSMIAMLLIIPAKIEKISGFKIFFSFFGGWLFESCSLVVAICLGFKLCLFITRKILKGNEISVISIFYDLLRVFIFICIPLMIMGTVFELYLTPFLFKIL